MSSSQCFSNPPTPSPNSGAGSVEELGGLKTYVTGSQHSKLAILFIADAFGYEAPNLRKLADKVAAAGLLVVVPDFFYGEPFEYGKPPLEPMSWLKAHDPDKGCEDAKTVISALKTKGMSAIGAAGFCWGGMVVAKLAKFSDIRAAVVLHPGHITVDEINEVRVPIAILGAENDKICSQEHLKHLGVILSAKNEVESFVKIFPRVEHGWTVRYNADDEFAVKSAEEAHSDMLNWLTKYVRI